MSPLMIGAWGEDKPLFAFRYSPPFYSGSTPLGEQGGWPLTIKTDPQSRVILLSSPETKPPNLELKIVQEPAQNHATLQLGLFNPGDSIDLSLIIINPANVEHPTIKAETRIPNLSEPIVTREPLRKRFESAYLSPFIIFFCAVIFVGIMWVFIKYGLLTKPKRSAHKLIESFGMIIIAFSLSFIFSSAISAGLVRLLVKLISSSPNR